MPVRPSVTAEMVALIRAREHDAVPEGRRLIDDGYSGRFLAAAGSRWVDAQGRSGMRSAVVDASFKLPFVGLAALVLARHRVMDDLVREEMAKGPRQLVILGAGYDARAYRFAPPAGPARAFEVDHPTLSAVKKGYVAKALGAVPEHVRYVAVDFMTERLDERLLAEGFDPCLPAIFIWEGVTYYLSEEAVRGTLERLRKLAAPGSTIVFDAWARPAGALGPITAVARAVSARVVSALQEPFLYTLPSSAAAGALLEDTGWRPIFVRDSASLRGLLRENGRRLLYMPSYVVVAAGRIPEGAAPSPGRASVPPPG